MEDINSLLFPEITLETDDIIMSISVKKDYSGIEDLNQMMMLLSDFCPQGVLLKKTGCYETKVDVKEVLDIINSKN